MSKMGSQQILRKYYLEQARTGRGGPIVYWKGSRMQRGSGIGTVLQGIFKSPIVRKGMQYVAKTGLSTAGDVLSGLIDGVSCAVRYGKWNAESPIMIHVKYPECKNTSPGWNQYKDSLFINVSFL